VSSACDASLLRLKTRPRRPLTDTHPPRPPPGRNKTQPLALKISQAVRAEEKEEALAQDAAEGTTAPKLNTVIKFTFMEISEGEHVPGQPIHGSVDACWACFRLSWAGLPDVPSSGAAPTPPPYCCPYPCPYCTLTHSLPTVAPTHVPTVHSLLARAVQRPLGPRAPPPPPHQPPHPTPAAGIYERSRPFRIERSKSDVGDLGWIPVDGRMSVRAANPRADAAAARAAPASGATLSAVFCLGEHTLRGGAVQVLRDAACPISTG